MPFTGKLAHARLLHAHVQAFKSNDAFVTFAKSETDDIIARDTEDGNKLAAGIELAVAKGVLPAEPPVEPVTKIDVLGKTADAVAG